MEAAGSSDDDRGKHQNSEEGDGKSEEEDEEEEEEEEGFRDEDPPDVSRLMWLERHCEYVEETIDVLEGELRAGT